MRFDFFLCSFAPQEYITKVGQYLMTLPQHLEPYMTHDNLGLTKALQVLTMFMSNI